MTNVRVRVWDLPTRLFHWTLLLAMGSVLATGIVPGVRLFWHAAAGYLVLTLLIFRLIWGFVGGHWSRFRTFVPSLSALEAALRGRETPADRLGHGALGGAAVVAILGALFLQVVTGMLAVRPDHFEAPLAKFVSEPVIQIATALHTTTGKWLLLAVLGVHIAAVLFLLVVRKRDLLGPMLHGNQHCDAAAMASHDGRASRWLALWVLALCGGGVFLFVRSFG